MTLGAARNPVAVGELRPMWVLMTLRALSGRRMKVGVQERPFHGSGAMACGAFRRPVCAYQRKCCAAMVEQTEVVPLSRRMARLASQRAASGVDAHHACAELAAMGIGVACFASQRIEVIGNNPA